MKKERIILGSILLLCLLLLGFQWIRYSSLLKKGKNNFNQINLQLEKLNNEVKEKEKEKQSLEEENAWKIEVYKAWKKVVNQES